MLWTLLGETAVQSFFLLFSRMGGPTGRSTAEVQPTHVRRSTQVVVVTTLPDPTSYPRFYFLQSTGEWHVCFQNKVHSVYTISPFEDHEVTKHRYTLFITVTIQTFVFPVVSARLMSVEDSYANIWMWSPSIGCLVTVQRDLSAVPQLAVLQIHRWDSNIVFLWLSCSLDIHSAVGKRKSVCSLLS